MNNAHSRLSKIILVTGAARSGKSEWAETLAQQLNQPIIYIATAQVNPTDLEWQNRLEAHRLRRPPHWQIQEIPVNLVTFFQQKRSPHGIIVDSLGTWVANLLEQDENAWKNTISDFLTVLQTGENTLILVAEETGWGVVPAYPTGRRFRDRLGSLIRQVGAIADTVYLVTGGHILNLSELGTRL